ncbi:MAG: ATP-dependent zinc protease [Planctomycetes bacterium]|nr:ATP-dependent zinc protease [Planctomycetota bacterium]NUQ33487.1 ATP-dependent zinc protease [Planctomycetaceae bacterium]
MLKKKKLKKKRSLPVIGWREWVALPKLGVAWVKVKVDTGARTSALHAYDLSLFVKRGETWVRFVIHPFQRDLKTSITGEARVLEWRRVRSSNGKTEFRPVIETELSFMGNNWPIELTLSNRDEMGFRMLLGREAIRRKFTVHPSRSFFGGRPPVHPTHP